MMRTVDRAHGRWRDILIQLGIDPKYLVNKHGPCPLCGGRDRFRWDNRDGSGSYYCNGCGPGSGLILLRKLRDWSFKEAADAVDRIIGTAAAATAPAMTRFSLASRVSRLVVAGSGAADAAVLPMIRSTASAAVL